MSNEYLSIFHFNDVYTVNDHKCDSYILNAAKKHANNISTCSENCTTNAAKFTGLLNDTLADVTNYLVLFSGDAFSPSLYNVYHGKHMVAVLNHLRITAACVGNHEFDYGFDIMLQLVNKCNFPWLATNLKTKKNILTPDKEKILESFTEKTLIVNTNIGQIGLLGLIDKSWYDYMNLSMVTEYLDFIEVAKITCATTFKDCKCIIAVTHLEVNNDRVLFDQIPEINLIVGGHDHIIYAHQRNNRLLIKSGWEFNTASLIKIHKNLTIDYKFLSSCNSPIDISVNNILQKLETNLNKKLSKKIAESLMFFPVGSLVRTQETAIGQYVADIFRLLTDTDIVYIHGGTLRGNGIAKSNFRIMDVLELLPFNNTMICAKLTFSEIVKLLQASLERYPESSHLFPSISGIKIKFNTHTKEVSEIIFKDQIVTDLSKTVIISFPDFMVTADLGLIDKTKIVDHRNACLNLGHLMLKYFRILNIFRYICDKKSASDQETMETFDDYKCENIETALHNINVYNLDEITNTSKDILRNIADDILRNRKKTLAMSAELEVRIMFT